MSVTQKLNEIKNSFINTDDFFEIKLEIEGVQLIFLGLRSLIDVGKTTIDFKSQFLTQGLCRDDFIKSLKDSATLENSESNYASKVLGGKLIVWFMLDKEYVIVTESSPKTLTRNIEQPTNENVLQGTLSSFIEDININIGLIRKQIVTEDLHVRSFTVGKKQSRMISLLYVNGQVSNDLLHRAIDQINKNKERIVQNMQDVNRIISISPWSLVTQYKTTEVTHEAAKAISQGKLVLFVDQIPFAFILPSVLWDMFANENDNNYTYPLMIAIRSLRVIGFLLTLIVPGLYVALVSVNPEVLRIELALSIAQSREGVPYPAIVELIIMLVILELIIEASVRLPKSVGPTITMVGGIILGQAAVEAQLVSNLLIIILAATTIANSTIIGFQNSLSIRLFKYMIIILASIFGVLGIMAGLFLVCLYFSSISTLGIPFVNTNLSKERYVENE
nr:spore germination protein [Fictibacillus sp. 23RED33]